MSADPSAAAPARARVLAAAPVAFLLAATAVLALASRPPPLHTDLARDLLLARDCVDVGRCALEGPRSSFAGLVQGATWSDLLELCRAAGLGLRGVRAVVIALHATSAALVYFVPRRLSGSAAGPAACALYLAASAAAIELPVLWNPSALPLPLVVFHVCALGLAARGETIAAVAAGCALGLSMSAHLVCAALVPVFLAAAVATAARPALAVLAGALALAGTVGASSPGALLDDAPQLGAVKVPAALALVAAMALGAAVRARVRALPPTGRARALLWAECAYFAAALTAVCAATGRVPAPRYLAPVVPAAAVLAAAVVVGAFGRRVALGNALVVAAAGCALMAGARPAAAGERRAWTAFDVEALAPTLYADGREFRDLFRHLRGPDAYLLLAALAPYGPPPSRAPPREPLEDDLLVLEAPRARVPIPIPQGWTVIDLDARDVAVVRRGHSWMDLSRVEVCARPAGGAAPRCAVASLADEDPDRGAAGGFAHRAYPGIAALQRAFPPGDLARMAPFRWTIEVALHVGPDEPPRDVCLSDHALRWAVVEIDGVRAAGPLPAATVTLERGSGAGRMVLAADVPLGQAGSFVAWLPSFIETEATEDALRALAGCGEP